jgi:CBS domain containing-hemolysin-like protein
MLCIIFAAISFNHTLDIFFYIIVSLTLSAFFSGMEIAFVTSNKLRFELEKKQRNFTSSILGNFYNHPQQFVSTMLVGNNIALVIYGLLMAKLFEPLFSFTGNAFLSTLLQTIVATIIVLFTGEFLPKAFFRINPNLWLRFFSTLLLIFYTLLYPIAWFSTWLSRVILKIFRLNSGLGPDGNVFSRVDLDYLIRESFEGKNEQNEINSEVRFFQNALDFSKIRLRDCSVPRTEIVAIDIDNITLEALKLTFIETGYSKLPVYKDNIDNIIGYIHASEMFDQPQNWKKKIRQIPIVPESMTAHKLMKLFMQQRKSIAVVVDEHGGTDGIVTLEDIIEEIFGEIEDEHDTREYVARQLSENEYLLSGRMEVQLANERLGLHLPESDEYETVAGFILHHLQRLPKLNEVIKIQDITCRCIKVTSNRIELVRLILGS